MRRGPSARTYLLAPHIAAASCFVAAGWWMDSVGSNRSQVDLWLGIAGFVAGALSVLATIAAVLTVVFGAADRGRWPWLILHVAALSAVLFLASEWLGAHIA